VGIDEQPAFLFEMNPQAGEPVPKRRKVACVPVAQTAQPERLERKRRKVACVPIAPVASTEAILRDIQSSLERHAERVGDAFENAMPRDRGPQMRTAMIMDSQIDNLHGELVEAVAMCERLKARMSQLRRCEDEAKATAQRAFEAIHPAKIKAGPLRSHWYCSAADNGYVCTGGHPHTGIQGFRPTREKKKVTKHIQKQHRPKTAAEQYPGLDWVE